MYVHLEAQNSWSSWNMFVMNKKGWLMLVYVNLEASFLSQSI